MRFGISIPQGCADGFDATAFRAYLRRAEELGFDSGWTQEQVLTMSGMPHLGATETMTYAVACTERLRLGCSVFVTPLHNPVHLAKSLATLDFLSGGRLEVGVGTGGQGRMFSAFEVDPTSLVSRFTEGVRLLKELWASDKVDFDGRFWQLHGAAVDPKPVQRPGPPLWFGGSAPAALRRAVRYGDGFFGAGSTTTAKFTEQVRVVREALAESDRDPADFGFAKRIYFAIDDDGDRARGQVDADLERLYGKPGLGVVAVAGTAADVVAGAQEVAAAGAELILFTPLSNEAEQMELVAAEVVPRLR
ncbi:LLM class flavin-dependent oxidoreductase [Amycolatopsis sp. K13G38]|uniref:LLM class flavin-dependent oxidoreductase n=1 Tax=Amycolatopsis acididurans TaxID=2724524 RepID=A0ABX1JA88_9PSEU|nr:LLM class flavin-dependent oxidoreductase [Amycolatopsis acididurans]NKQ56702.1 LLM class flavin-dependent oxidoreductase [Amycolatopsis acididurans]